MAKGTDLSIRLRADNKDLKKGLKEAENEIKRLRSEVDKSKSSFNSFGKGIGSSISSMIGPLSLATAGIAAMSSTINNAFNTLKSFEQSNANLAATLGKSRNDIIALTEGAKQLGATSVYTASQITDLQTELAKLGFNETQILAMQKGVSQFATALGSDAARSASLTGAVLRSFGLTVNNTTEAVSILTLGVNKSALSFEYLETAIPIVSAVAKSMGFNLKDVTALLGTLANSGFDASMASTALRNIFLNLANDGGKLSKAIGRPVRSIDDLIEGLQKLNKEGVDIATVLELTDKRSVAQFKTFMDNVGALKQLRSELNDTGDVLEKNINERINTVEGSTKLLESAWENFVLTFKNSAGPIKGVLDFLTDGLNETSRVINLFGKGQTKYDLEIQTYLSNNENEIKRAGEVESSQVELLSNKYQKLGLSIEEATNKAVEERMRILLNEKNKLAYDSRANYQYEFGITKEQLSSMKEYNLYVKKIQEEEKILNEIYQNTNNININTGKNINDININTKELTKSIEKNNNQLQRAEEYSRKYTDSLTELEGINKRLTNIEFKPQQGSQFNAKVDDSNSTGGIGDIGFIDDLPSKTQEAIDKNLYLIETFGSLEEAANKYRDSVYSIIDGTLRLTDQSIAFAEVLGVDREKMEGLMKVVDGINLAYGIYQTVLGIINAVQTIGTATKVVDTGTQAAAIPVILGEAAAYKSLAAASAAAATSSAAAAAASGGPIAAIAAAAATAAGVTSSTITAGGTTLAGIAAFNEGGIVGGNSYSGDKVLARLNSGEMILNSSQQRQLWEMANGGNNSIGGNVEFKIRGQELVGVISNYNKKYK